PFDFAQGKTFARNDKAHERLPTRGGHCRVARFAGKISSAGSMAASRRTVTEIDATAWAKGASARSGSDGGVGKNRGRIYRNALGTGRFARRHSLRARAPTGVAL